MTISVTSTTTTSITVSCAYPLPSTPGGTKAITASAYSCTITWYWIRDTTSSAWSQNGWDHNAPGSRSYGPDGDNYSGTIYLDSGGVSPGTRPNAPTTGSSLLETYLTATNQGTAYYSGTVSQPSSGAGGSTITRTKMYRNDGAGGTAGTVSVGDGSASNSFSYTFSGLSSGSTYILSVQWFSGTGGTNDLGSNSASGTTNSSSSPPSGTPSVAHTSLEGSVFVSWTAVSGATNYNVYANDNAGSGDVLKYSGSSTETTVSLAREHWPYTIKVVPTNSAGSGGTGSLTVRTRDMTSPTFSWGSVSQTATTITLNISPSDTIPTNGAASGVTSRHWYKHNGTSFVLITSNSSNSYTFTGLSADTTYLLGAAVSDAAGNNSSLLSSSVTTTRNRPTNWAWATAKVSGGNFNITATEWNAFTSRINAFETYLGLSTHTFPAVSTGQNFTADHWEEVASAIGSMTGNTPTYYEQGDGVTAAAINWLRDELNSIF